MKHRNAHGGFRRHTAPEIARHAAAHIQNNHQPDKDWMGGKIPPEPSDNQTGAMPAGPGDAVQASPIGGRAMPDGLA